MDFAGVDMEVESVERGEAAECLAQVRDIELVSQQALRSHQSLALVPGGRLIRRRSER